MGRKIIHCILAIFIAWLLAILLHNLGVNFYKKTIFLKETYRGEY